MAHNAHQYAVHGTPAPAYSSSQYSWNDQREPPLQPPSNHPSQLRDGHYPSSSYNDQQQPEYRSHGPYEGDRGDISSYPSRPTDQYGYENPYDDDRRSPSPTVGPWDSASQMSVSTQAATDYPGNPRRQISHQGGLSYIDEESNYHDRGRPGSMAMHEGDVEMKGLVGNAADMGTLERGGGMGKGPQGYPSDFQADPYGAHPAESGPTKWQEPSGWYSMMLFPTGLDRLLVLFGMNAGKFPVEQAIERKRRGVGGQRWPVAAWTLTAIMCGVMIYELIANNNATGSPIATKPTFNYMIGPSPSVLINVGARFPPCMKLVDSIPPTMQIACLNDTSGTATSTCTIEDICGHGGFDGAEPDQSWRFFTPIFLHVGIVHLLLNMLAQVTAAAQVEREMGTIPFLIVYIAGGIYGFVLGGNFSRPGIPSVGASGALFATNACVLIDLLLHWKYEERPKLKAFLLAVEFAIGFAIGYIPNAVDGLAHLGGWAMGILFGMILYPSISETKRHRFIVWGMRVLALVLIVVAFALTVRNFYTTDPNAACEWCKYLSCIPMSANDYCKGSGLRTVETVTRRSWDAL